MDHIPWYTEKYVFSINFVRLFDVEICIKLGCFFLKLLIYFSEQTVHSSVINWVSMVMTLVHMVSMSPSKDKMLCN